ncbi:hypothetical protein GCM10008967_28830 [Bacillus carboniphilus]|uniref:SLH domain-containing protein n=1 Tax=Bacillus carboniphilus TaxID=86663 RepID=A0ABP3G5L7_9BACI
MSYQPKTSRKFIAATATATLVATAVVPAASAASFTDVSDRYKEAVDYLVANNITAGLTETTFGVSQNIKRGDAAIFLAKSLGLDIDNAKDAGFTDVNDRVKPYVNALKAAGYINGKTETTFAPDAPITRGEMALILANAYSLEGNVELDFNDVNSRYTEAVKGLFANGITEGVTEDKFGTDQAIKRGDFAIFLHRADTLEVLASGISGFIMDGTTPVVGATVTIGKKSVQTNEQGFYTLLDVVPGDQKVTVEAVGFKTTTSDVKVVADQVTSFTSDISSQEINTAAIEVSGVVVDAATGADLVDATVTLEAFDTETEEWITVATANVVAGEYTVNQTTASNKLELGAEYRLTVSKDDYKDHVQMITLDSQEVSNVLAGIELEEIAAMNISGTVTNATGEVVVGASVKISDEEGNELATATTDADGVYSVEDAKLVDGTYNVVVDHADSAVSYTEFAVVEGINATHNVQLEAGNAIAASIGTESTYDQFVADGTYTMEILSGKTVIGTQTATATASTLGFDFSRIAPGEYTLKLTGDYVETKEFSIIVDGDETFEGRAVPAGVIDGTVTGTSETVKVDLIDAEGNIVETLESTDGSYKFAGVTAGDYKVQASGDGLLTNASDELTVTKNATTTVEAISLVAVETTGDVAGFVRVDGTLAAVEGATVTYYDEEGNEAGKATTAANGSYSISDLEAGTYDVVVRGTGIETFTTTQAVKAGDNLTAVNYELTTGGNASLEITVVDSEGNPVDVKINGFDLADAFIAEENASVGTWEEADAVTDTVTFNNLSAGAYSLSIDVASEDFVDVEGLVAIAKGEAAELEIVVDEVAAQSAVNFLVVDETNTNVEDATVVVFNEDGSIKDILTTTAGTAALALVDGNYTLAVYQNGYAVSTQEITVSGDDVNVPVIQLSPIK